MRVIQRRRIFYYCCADCNCSSYCKHVSTASQQNLQMLMMLTWTTSKAMIVMMLMIVHRIMVTIRMTAMTFPSCLLAVPNT